MIMAAVALSGSPPTSLASSPSALATQFPNRRGMLEAPSGSKYGDFLRTWTDAHVQRWLQEIRCGHLAATFKQNDIRSDVLLELEQATLKEMGITSIGDRLRILNGVKALRARCNTRSHQARTSILIESTPSPAPVVPPPQRSPSTSRRPAPLQLATRPLPNHPGPNSAATTPLSGHPNRNNRLPPPPMPPPSTGARTPINAPDYTSQPLPPAPSLLTPVSGQPASWAPYGLPSDPRAGKPPRSTSPLPNPPPRGASFSPGFAPSRSPALQAAAHGRNLSASSATPPNPPPKTSARPSTAGSHPYAHLAPGAANTLSPINEGFNSTLPSPSGFSVGRGPFPQSGSQQQSQSQLQQQQAARPGTPSAPSNAPSLVDLRRKLVKFQLADEGHGTTINVEDCAGGVEVLERALKKFGKLGPNNRAAERAGTDDGGLSVDGWSVYLDWGDDLRPGMRRTPLSEAQLLAICHSKADDPARERGLTLRRSAKSAARMKALAALSPSSADPGSTPPLSPLQTTMNPDFLLPDETPARPKNYRRASTISVLSGLGVPFPEKATDAMENDRPLSPSSPASAAWTKQGRRASAAAAKVRNFFGQRPPSELIGAHLREFFPGADKRVLKRTSIMRASGVPGQRRDSAGTGRRDSTWSFHPAQGPGSRFSVSTIGSGGGSRASKRVSMASMAPSVRPRAGMELPPDEAASAAGTPRVSVSTDDATLVDSESDYTPSSATTTTPNTGLLPPVEFPRESLSDSLSATLAAPNPSRASRRLSHVTELKSKAKDTSDAASMMTVDEITEAVETRRSGKRGEADTASMIEGWTHVGGEEAVEEAVETAPVTPDDVPMEEEDVDVDVDVEDEYDEDEYDEETEEEEEDEEEEEFDEDAEDDDEDEEDGTGRAETSGDIKWIKGALIGSGSFGRVYLGMDATNGLLMAVKQVELADNMASDRRRIMVEALEREIELLKDLQHDHIVQYLYSSADEAHFNIFLEYVPGGSVAALLRNYGAFEEPLVRNFVRQILEGLDYVHERGIVHRDLKGANVLVDNKGGIKISDFGVSKKLEDNLMPGNRLHRPSLQGSVFWMAPEVVKQTAYTKKADIWSVGCLVVEMFTGEHPWAQLNQMQAIFKIGAGNSVPPIPRDISTDAQSFLERCFELNHELRPTAGDLLQHTWLAKKAGKAARRDALAVAAATAQMQ